ncbi:bactofilin family protein [Alkaliphilus crotonatoxidans]
MSKKQYLVWPIIIIVLMLTGLFSFSVQGQPGRPVNIAGGEVVEGDYIKGANRVVNEGNIKGDFIVAAQEVTQSGTIEGDFIGAVNHALIDGEVKGNIRSIVQSIGVQGEVNKNASVLASHFTLEEEGAIDGSLYAFVNYLNIKGTVGGDIRGAAGTVIITGRIKGDVVLRADKLYLEPNAIIEGDLIYTSSSPQEIDPSSVKGIIEYRPADEKRLQLNKSVFLRTLFLISYLLVGLLFLRLFQGPAGRSAAFLNEKPLLALGIGLVLLVMVPVISFLLLISIIGIPIAILAMALYGILIYLAKIPVELWLGKKILRQDDRPYLSFIIGSLLIASLRFIPYLGWLITLGIIGLGIGLKSMMIKTYYSSSKEL